MISAGLLTTAIEVLEPTIEVSEYGEERAKWDNVFCATRCHVVRRSGRRALILGEVSEGATREIIMRWRPGIHFRQRVRFPDEGTTYLIDSCTPSRRDGSITMHLSLLNE